MDLVVPGAMRPRMQPPGPKKMDLAKPQRRHGTYKVPAGISVTHVHPPTFLYDLLDFAPTFFSGSLVAGAQELVGSVGDGGGQDGIEGQDGYRLVEPLVAEALPDAIDSLLGGELALLFLLVRIGCRCGRRHGPLVLTVAVLVVRVGRGRVAVHDGQQCLSSRVVWEVGNRAVVGLSGEVGRVCVKGRVSWGSE